MRKTGCGWGGAPHVLRGGQCTLEGMAMVHVSSRRASACRRARSGLSAARTIMVLVVAVANQRATAAAPLAPCRRDVNDCGAGFRDDFVLWNDGMACMVMDKKEGRLFDECFDYLDKLGNKVRGCRPYACRVHRHRCRHRRRHRCICIPTGPRPRSRPRPRLRPRLRPRQPASVRTSISSDHVAMHYPLPHVS